MGTPRSPQRQAACDCSGRFGWRVFRVHPPVGAEDVAGHRFNALASWQPYRRSYRGDVARCYFAFSALTAAVGIRHWLLALAPPARVAAAPAFASTQPCRLVSLVLVFHCRETSSAWRGGYCGSNGIGNLFAPPDAARSV